MSEKIAVSMKINGKEVTLLSAPEQNLLRLLRENGYVEVKCGCEEGDCGTCTVLLDGLSVKSCVTPACACEGREVWTAAGVSRQERIGRLLRDNFAKYGASQCGFCTPGMMVTGVNYLMNNGMPDRQAIRAAISGNLCRCTGYKKIIDAIYYTAQELRRETAGEEIL